MNTVWWVDEGRGQRVAIVARPWGEESLEEDLAAMKKAGIDVVVSLLGQDETEMLGLAAEGAIAERLGMRFIAYPVPDRCTPPDEAGFRVLVNELAGMVREGRRVGAHCRACIGRSTVLIASLLIALGMDPEEALRRIEAARACRVPDTREQLEWILQFRVAP